MPGLIDNHVHIVDDGQHAGDLPDPTPASQTIEARAAEEARADAAARLHHRARPRRPGVRHQAGDRRRQGRRARASIPAARWSRRLRATATRGCRTSARAASSARCRCGEQLGFNFIADGRDEVLTATRENLRFGATQIKVHGRRRRGHGLRSARRHAVHAGRDEGRGRGGRRLGHLRHRARLHAARGAPRRRGGRQVHRARPAARRGHDQAAR